MSCKHNWKILHSEISESMMEQAVRLGGEITEGNASIFTKKSIQIVTCDKCGKIRKYVEEV
ncbi:hypothetical protein KAR91_32995 [Candidatus Pacearchaeota archaeon]|nr:hypothetical protein [Candidatus Pacearchaeota archaeon]